MTVKVDTVHHERSWRTDSSDCSLYSQFVLFVLSVFSLFYCLTFENMSGTRLQQREEQQQKKTNDQINKFSIENILMRSQESTRIRGILQDDQISLSSSQLTHQFITRSWIEASRRQSSSRSDSRASEKEASSSAVISETGGGFSHSRNILIPREEEEERLETEGKTFMSKEKKSAGSLFLINFS